MLGRQRSARVTLRTAAVGRRSGGLSIMWGRWWDARSLQALSGGGRVTGLRAELSRLWSGFWWTLLAVGC